MSTPTTHFGEVGSLIRSHYHNEIELDIPLVSHYDNMPDPVKPPTEPWARLSIIYGESLKVETGKSNRFRTTGQIVVQVFVPVETGDGIALELADKVAAVFRTTTIGDTVHTRTPSVRRIGRDGPYWQVNVWTPFYADLLA